MRKKKDGSVSNASVLGAIVVVLFAVLSLSALAIHILGDDPTPVSAYQVVTVDGVRCVTYYNEPVSCEWPK